jgi:hypothetical protein
MPEDGTFPVPHFEPLRRASRARLILAYVVGPFVWLVSLVVVAVVLRHTRSIELGLLITAGSFLLALVVLLLLHARRRRQERLYASDG